jgi:hypothetical protein
VAAPDTAFIMWVVMMSVPRGGRPIADVNDPKAIRCFKVHQLPALDSR